MRRVRVAADRWNFELEGTGELVTPIGGNILSPQHPGQGTLFDRFDAADCDRRLGLMADLGLNCLRQAIGVNRVFDPATGLKAEGMRNWEVFAGLAARHGIWLMPVGGYLGGNDWFDVARLADSGRQLDHDCAFWQAFCGAFRDHPAIWSWDLRNELLLWNRPHGSAPGTPEAQRIEAMLFDRWPHWLEVKYGEVATMNRVHGARHADFASVPRQCDFENAPFDPRAADVRAYLNDRGWDWCRRQVEAIRAADPGRMVCSGNNTWLNPDLDLFLANGFHSRSNHELFDFTTFHPYPAWQAVPGGRGDPADGGAALAYWLSACIGMARYEHQGKPVVMQEFGWYGGGASKFIGDLPARSEASHAAYTEALVAAVEPHINGVLNWPVFDMPQADDISNHGGIFTHDGQPKALTGVFRAIAARHRGRRQVRARATAVLEWSLLGLHTSRASQDRFWDEVHRLVQAGMVFDVRFV
jgi:hypothetical protein